MVKPARDCTFGIRKKIRRLVPFHTAHEKDAFHLDLDGLGRSAFGPNPFYRRREGRFGR